MVHSFNGFFHLLHRLLHSINVNYHYQVVHLPFLREPFQNEVSALLLLDSAAVCFCEFEYSPGQRCDL